MGGHSGKQPRCAVTTTAAAPCLCLHSNRHKRAGLTLQELGDLLVPLPHGRCAAGHSLRRQHLLVRLEIVGLLHVEEWRGRKGGVYKEGGECCYHVFNTFVAPVSSTCCMKQLVQSCSTRLEVPQFGLREWLVPHCSAGSILPSSPKRPTLSASRRCVLSSSLIRVRSLASRSCTRITPGVQEEEAE
jgi:hypothetical protein